MRIQYRVPVLLAALAVLGACRKSSLVIESSTSWSGTVSEDDKPAYKIEGTGNRTYEMPTDDFCWTIQKQTEDGRLYVVAKVPDLISTDLGSPRETYEPFGVAKGCSGAQ